MAFKGFLDAELSISASLSALPSINDKTVLDVYDYFKTEDNIDFLVTESGEYLAV
jgi:hypothetical protein